jgi:quinol monooxygenase YgiN
MQIQEVFMLVVLVQVHVKPESIDAFRRVTLENARHSMEEPGVAGFDVLQDENDPAHFILIETYRSDEATVAHKETAHYRVWRETVEPMMEKSRTSMRYRRQGGEVLSR